MMRKSRNRSQRIDTVFVLLIFCVFAVSVLMVLMLSASTYKNMNDISQDEIDERTALSFIWTKIKSNSGDGGVFVDYFYGIPALCFDSHVDYTFEEIELFSDEIDFYDDEPDYKTFRTMIYYLDGGMYELYFELGVDLEPDSGVFIIDVDSLTFQDAGDGLIRIISGTRSMLVYPASGTTGGYADE